MVDEMVVAAERVTEDADPDEEWFECHVDDPNDPDKTIRYYKPGDGQLALFLARAGSKKQTAQIGGVIDFFYSCIDERDQGYIEDRLLDRRDPFGVVDVEEIIEGWIEEWSGRPTKSPSDYQRSQRSGGRKSTRRTTRST